MAAGRWRSSLRDKIVDLAEAHVHTMDRVEVKAALKMLGRTYSSGARTEELRDELRTALAAEMLGDYEVEPKWLPRLVELVGGGAVGALLTRTFSDRNVSDYLSSLSVFTSSRGPEKLLSFAGHYTGATSASLEPLVSTLLGPLRLLFVSWFAMRVAANVQALSRHGEAELLSAVRRALAPVKAVARRPDKEAYAEARRKCGAQTSEAACARAGHAVPRWLLAAFGAKRLCAWKREAERCAPSDATKLRLKPARNDSPSTPARPHRKTPSLARDHGKKSQPTP